MSIDENSLLDVPLVNEEVSDADDVSDDPFVVLASPAANSAADTAPSLLVSSALNTCADGSEDEEPLEP